MYLLAIDDLLLSDVGIGTATDRPLITDRSERRGFTIRRRETATGSAFFGGSPEPARWVIVIKCPDTDARDAVLAVLGGDLLEERRLLAERDDGYQTRVVIDAAPLRIDQPNEYDLIVEFESADSLWRNETVTLVSKTFTSGNDLVMPLTLSGNTRSAAAIILAPAAAKTTPTATVGWRYRKRYVVTWSGAYPIFRRPLRISLGSTTALVSGGKAQADGDDVRVWLDGVEQMRTLVTWNTAASYVWVIIPALLPNASMTYDVVYGNASAPPGPALARPELPPFKLDTSNNDVWDYAVADDVANAGLGVWTLSSPTFPAVPDYSAPGAWRPAHTLQVPDDVDHHYQLPTFRITSTDAGSRFEAQRVFSEVGGYQDDNEYDGIVFYSPVPITTLRADFRFRNEDDQGEIVYLCRPSSATRWISFFEENTTVTETTQTIPATTETLPTPSPHVAVALWPANGISVMSFAEDRAVYAYFDTQFQVGFDTTDLAITASPAEEEIYELATELRLGGGVSRVAPYQSLLVGNARDESGAGTPRAAVTLAQAVLIDGEKRSHEVWGFSGGDVTSYVEHLSAHAVEAVAGWNDDGVAEEAATSGWLVLTPTRVRVPNGDFAVDIGGWLSDTTTSGMTTARSWESTLGGTQAGSLKMAVTPNSAGVGAIAPTISAKQFAVNGRESIDLAAWVRTSNANLTPLLALTFYETDGTLISATNESDWTPVADTGYRRAFSARVPARAALYTVGLWVYADTAGATGNVYFDDVRLLDTDLVVRDAAMSSLTVITELRGRWL